MLVCIDKVTCVRMHGLIERYWAERIAELEAEHARAPGEQEAIHLRRQIEWMRETRAAVVVSEEQGEVEKFRRWDLDIRPHRRLNKEGLELPPALRRLPRLRNLQRMPIDDAFKEPEHPFRIAVVCAMWLTGFDVPSLATLCLDKPARPDDELLADLAEAIAMVRRSLDDARAPLDDVIQKLGFARNAAIVACKEAANENDETRKRFEILCREVFKEFAHRPDRDAIDVIYRSLQHDREQADVSDILRALPCVVDGAIDVRGAGVSRDRPPYDISRIDFDRLKREFQRSRARRTTDQTLRHAVEERLRRLLARNPLRTDFQRHYEEIVAEYNREKDRVTIERTFEELLRFVRELAEEESRAVREGLVEESMEESLAVSTC